MSAHRSRTTLALFGGMMVLSACGGSSSIGITKGGASQADLTANTQGVLSARVNTNACLDVINASTSSGAGVQIWQCTGGTNQVWQLKSSSVVVYGKLCLAESAPDAGSVVNVVTCDASDSAQAWRVNGEHLVNTASGRCLDVRNGGIANGTKLQVWDCAKGNSNQSWLMPNAKAITDGNSTQSTPTTSSSATTTPSSSAIVNDAISQSVNFSDWGIGGGFTAMPLDKLLALHPQLAGAQQAFVDAAAQASPNVPPQLLMAICLEESSGGLDASNGGPFQFTDASAWQAYGPAGGDMYNMNDAAKGAANYIAYLLKTNGNDLNSALRSYNGPVANGGNPQYQSQIQQWMQGVAVYGTGV